MNLKHLSARMRQTGHWNSANSISEKELRGLISDRIENLDIRAAREDVKPFVRDKAALTVWSKEFFMHVAERMVVGAL